MILVPALQRRDHRRSYCGGIAVSTRQFENLFCDDLARRPQILAHTHVGANAWNAASKMATVSGANDPPGRYEPIAERRRPHSRLRPRVQIKAPSAHSGCR